MTRTPIEAGDLHVIVSCPRCGERVDASVHLAAKLTVVTGAIGELKPTMKTKAVEHLCGQLRIEDPAEDEAEPAERELDFAELAAGEGARHDGGEPARRPRA